MTIVNGISQDRVAFLLSKIDKYRMVDKSMNH